jgi:hypothetical protein
MQRTAHAALERGIDHLVLLHAGLALEGGGNHGGGVMVAVAAQVLDASPAASGRAALIIASISAAAIAIRSASSLLGPVLYCLPAI